MQRCWNPPRSAVAIAIAVAVAATGAFILRVLYTCLCDACAIADDALGPSPRPPPRPPPPQPTHARPRRAAIATRDAAATQTSARPPITLRDAMYGYSAQRQVGLAPRSIHYVYVFAFFPRWRRLSPQAAFGSMHAAARGRRKVLRIRASK